MIRLPPFYQFSFFARPSVLLHRLQIAVFADCIQAFLLRSAAVGHAGGQQLSQAVRPAFQIKISCMHALQRHVNLIQCLLRIIRKRDIDKRYRGRLIDDNRIKLIVVQAQQHAVPGC